MSESIVIKALVQPKQMMKLDALVLFILFFLSGLSGLIYESAWSQQLALIFGSTELAIAAVLASYMGGLAMGASLISLFIKRIKKPIIVYAIIEALIAISALSVPYLLTMVSQFYSDAYTTTELSSISPSNAFTYIVGSFTVLLIPTSLMGATLPLLSKYSVRDGDNLGNKIGLLYSINTLGACIGALVGAFVLLPLFGLGMTIYVAVLINLIIFIIGLFYFRNKALAIDQADSAHLTNKIFKNKWIFPVMFISGAVSLAYEILWTRLLSHVLGGSIYSFGVMLFVFLLAIAMGAYFGSLICKKYNPLKSFTWVQFGIAISFIISFYFANLLPDIAIERNYGSFSFVYESLAIGLITLFPGALFIGATFPLAINITAINNRHSGTVAARVYTWNTVGAIFGSILMGFYLLSSFGFARSSQLLSSMSLLLAIIVIVFSTKNLKILVLMMISLTLIWLIPQDNPYRLLKFSVLGERAQSGQISYLGIGESATVILLDQGGEMRLLTNGLPESSIQIKGSRVGKFHLASWLSMLPVLVNPEAQDMLIVGLGAGLTLKAVPASIKNIDVVELEQEVINANISASHWRGVDPLLDSRLKLHNNDARNALRNSTQMFDIIVSQPSHPWTAGASSLYTQEFFSLVKQRLRDKGVFIQWIGMRFVDIELLKSLLATLNKEF
ncbi:MAG: fused MFS/spermidine synthase, partial [Alcanivoracaceae bacterium]|nr:fused MFS/spermidine synthase [Alcanivoracaceae bacterium]